MIKFRLSPGLDLALRIIFVIMAGFILVTFGVIQTADYLVSKSAPTEISAVYKVRNEINGYVLAAIYSALIIPLLLLFVWYLLLRPLARAFSELNAAVSECPEHFSRTYKGLSGIARILKEIRVHVREKSEEALAKDTALQGARAELDGFRCEMIHSEKLATVGKMTAGIMHEIGNPLAAVIGYVELLLQDRCPKEQELDFLRRIDSELLRINQMIKDVLGLSRASAPSIESVSLDDSIQQVLGLLSHQKTMQYIDVKLHLDPGLPLVRADAQQLKQILLNLIDNSVYAMPAGGALTITSELKAYGQEVETDVVTLEVEDTGTGIPAEVLGKIFEPFFTTKPAGEGNGLGLSISKRIMESFGGSISVISKVGAGTRFTLSFRT